MTAFHPTARFPRGFRCASRNVGLKPEAKDLTLFVSEVDAAAAAVFTRYHFPGAPIIVGRETIRGGVLRAIIANSKVSNVATGAAGVANARRMAAAAAAELGTTPEQVLVSYRGDRGAAPGGEDRSGSAGDVGRPARRSLNRRGRDHDDRHAPEGDLLHGG